MKLTLTQEEIEDTIHQYYVAKGFVVKSVTVRKADDGIEADVDIRSKNLTQLTVEDNDGLKPLNEGD